MNKRILEMVCILSAANALATNWSGGGSNTLFSNALNWGGAVPLQGESSTFAMAGPYAVSFPAGGYSDKSVTEITTPGTVTFDTLGSWWLKPANSTWGNPTFRVGGGAHGFNIESVSNDKAQMLMSNAVFKAFTSATAITNTLVSGALNFYDPDGIQSGNKVVIGHDNNRSHFVVLEPGTATRWNTIEFRAKGPENLFRILGGTHAVFNTLDIANQNQAGRTGTLRIDGGELITHSLSRIGLNKSQLGQLIIATNGTWTANQTPEIGGTGVGEVTLAGGTLAMGPGNINLSVGHNNGGTGTFNVLAGTLNANNYQTLVGNGTTAVGRFNLSGGHVATKYFHVAISNGSTGIVAMTGGSWTNSGNGQMGQAGVATMTVTGGSLTWNDWLMVGAGATSVGHLTLAGGTTQFTDIMPGYYGGNGTVDITGGDHRFNRIRLAYAPCVRSLFRISGGTNTFYGNDGILVGVQGQAEMIINGGIVTSTQIRIGQGSNQTAAVSSLLINGGATSISTINVADNLNNSGRLILNGGVFAANQIRGWTGAAVKGGKGQALLEADGGTLRARQNNSGLIQDFDAAILGVQGLTIDTDGFTVTVPQIFSNQSSVSGLLIKSGAGTLTLAGANKHDTTVVASGTLALSANHCVGGSLVITNNGVFSTVGAVNTVTLQTLTVGDADKAGWLAVDNADTIIITAASGLALPFAKLILSSPVTDGTYTLFTCTGNLPATLLQNTEVANPSAGKVYSLSASYTPATDTTDLILTIQEKSSFSITEREWDGDSGSAWNTAGSWSADTVPQGGEAAVFPQSAVNKNITTTAGATAGILQFNAASSYALDGTESLTLDNDGRFGEINALAGAHAVSAPLTLPRTIISETAPDTAVTLSGALSGNGGITKIGSGQLTLSAASSFRGITAVNGGRLTLAHADAFGDAPDDRENLMLRSGTLQYSGTPTLKTRGITLEAATPTNAVILDVQSDLTLSGQPWAEAGALIKRGAGLFELQLSGTANKLSVGNGMAHNNTLQNADLNFPPNGDSPSEGYAGFTVAEGLFRLTGTPGSVTRIENVAAIGARTTQGTASPALEIDGGTVYLGGGSMHTYIGAFTPSGSVMTNPALRVIGGARLIANTLHFGSSAATPVNPEFLIDDAIAEIYYIVNLANQASGTSAITVRNGAVLSTTANEIRANNRFNLLIDSGTVAVLNPASRFTCAGNAAGTVLLTNGGRLALPRINMESSQGVTLAFDNGVYQPTADGMLIFRNDSKHTVDIRSGGAVFEVNEGLTYTVARPLTGIGGVTKTGTGTLIFSETLQDNGATTNRTDLIAGSYAGATLVTAGTLIVSNGTIRTDAQMTVADGATLALSAGTTTLASIAGTGTVTDGTLAAALLSPGLTGGAIGTLTVNGLQFANALLACDLVQADDGKVTSNDTVAVTGVLTGAGFVDFGRTSDNPLKLPCTLTVMSYNPANGTPDVSGWKVRNTGVSATFGKFTAAAGAVSVTVSYGGTILIIQ